MSVEDGPGTQQPPITGEATQGALLPHRILERDTELVAAQTALDEVTGRTVGGAPRHAAARRGGLLAFTGPAGGGKTTVLAEVRRLAAEQGCVWLSAQGGELEQQVAFHVVRQLLQPLLASCSDDERHELMGDWYDIVAPCVGICSPPQDGAAPDPEGVRCGLDWVVTNIAVKRGPLVVAIDDAHWADAESLAWVASFATKAHDRQTLMIVAYRPDELPEQAVALADVATRNRARLLDLAPLSKAAVSSLVKDALGEGADAEFCHQAYVITGGNAFETVELATKARDRGLVPSQAYAPLLRNMTVSTTSPYVVERMEQLGADAVQLARVAALLGAEATMDLASSITKLGSEKTVDSANRLHSGGILGPVGDDGVLTVTHPLVAQAVYRSIPAATRVGLHGQAAEELVETGRGPTIAARHLLEVHQDGNVWVVEQLRHAAGEYLRTGAPDAARRCLIRALQEPPSPELRATVLYELGHPALVQDPAVAVEYLEEALEQPAVEPRPQEDIVIRHAMALGYADRMVEALARVKDEAASSTDPAFQLRLHAQRFLLEAFSSAGRKEHPDRSQRLEQLADRRGGSDRTEQCLMALRGWEAMMRSEPAEIALKYAERAVARGMSWTDEGDWGFEVPALAVLTFLGCDKPARAETLLSEGIAEFERQGWRGTPLATGYTYLGYIMYRTGRLVDAEDYARAGLRLADRVARGAPAHWGAVGTLIEILLARGKDDAAVELAERHHFREPFPGAVTVPDARTVRGRLLLQRGMTKEAAECLSENGRRFDPSVRYSAVWCPWLPLLALATHAADPERAREISQEVLRRAVSFGTETAVGQALYISAQLAEGLEAIGLLERAVTQLEQSPAAYELARAEVDLGTALRRAGRLADAADYLYRGVESAVRCGADGLVARARDELATAGLRPRRLRGEC
jgi:tetratricopeptide (TPR) repeat protein